MHWVSDVKVTLAPGCPAHPGLNVTPSPSVRQSMHACHCRFKPVHSNLRSFGIGSIQNTRWYRTGPMILLCPGADDRQAKEVEDEAILDRAVRRYDLVDGSDRHRRGRLPGISPRQHAVPGWHRLLEQRRWRSEERRVGK